MHKQVLTSYYKHILLSKNFILLNLNCNIKKMSTLENVIEGLNNVRCRIKDAMNKGVQVFVEYHVNNSKICIFY